MLVGWALIQRRGQAHATLGLAQPNRMRLGAPRDHSVPTEMESGDAFVPQYPESYRPDETGMPFDDGPRKASGSVKSQHKLIRSSGRIGPAAEGFRRRPPH